MRCVIVQPIDDAGLELLRAAGVEPVVSPGTAPAELLPLLRDADAVITRNFGFPANYIDAAPRLQVIAVHGTGTDRIAKPEAAARGISVVNTPGANAQSVAEHALALMLAAARALPQGDAATRAGNFDWRLTPEAAGIELAGRTLGLWGWGHISRRLARMARGIGMEVVVLSSHAAPEVLRAEGVAVAAHAADLITRSDVLSLHGVPGDKPLIGAEELAGMRPGAILVNTARGAMIDELALVQSLQSGHLRAAALDVFVQEPLPADHPLLSAPRLIVTPHVGVATQEALVRLSCAAAEAVLAALAARRAA